MSTTLSTLQAGSRNTVYVVAIEGYPRLLTTCGDSDAVSLGAWASTDWDGTDCITGLFVELDQHQQLHPWNPLMGGGTCTLRVVPHMLNGIQRDWIGVDMARTGATPETEITQTVNRTDGTIHVKRADEFPAAPSEAYIGNECFAYSATTSTTFTASQRGKYSPFGASDYDNTHFARYHRFGEGKYAAASQPKVTRYRRDWKSAWVGVWEHRVVDGVLDSKEEALCVFAGQIADYGDADTGETVINLVHILDVVKDTSLLHDQYRARIPVGITLTEGMFFYATDDMGAAVRTTASLTVKASPSGANEIATGFYTAQQLVAAINSWLAAEAAASRLYGAHSLSFANDLQLVDIHTFSAAGAGTHCHFDLRMPRPVSKFIGGDISQGPASDPIAQAIVRECVGNLAQQFTLPRPIARHGFATAFTSEPIELSDEQGVFVDNSGFVPAALSNYDDGTNAVGFFLVDGKSLIAGRVSGGQLSGGTLIVDSTETLLDSLWGDPFDSQEIDGTEIVQVVALGASWHRMLLSIFFSTGEFIATGTAYNNPTYDVLPYGLGLNLPAYDLLETAAASYLSPSIVTMPFSSLDTTVWITKPTKFAELFSVDLILRGSHLVWRSGKLQFQSWQSPVASAATITLTEDNKAEPVGHHVSQRSATLVDSSWARPIVKIQFDYDPLDDKFGSTVVLEDRPAIDGVDGQAPTITLAAKNFGFGQAAADAVDQVIPAFFARWIPMLSRPFPKITRSIAPPLYEGYAPGEVASVTDAFARDPATGLRGVSARAGLVLRHSYNPGGARIGVAKPEPPAGEVDVLVMPTNLYAIWSPAAEVDETANSGGFTAGYNNATKTLRCYANKHSEASETADALNFAANDHVDIYEKDPSAAPLSWTNQQVASVAGNDITLTAALAGFDTTKTYRIVSATYTSAQASQKTDAYQADDADGMILDTAPSYQYGLNGPGINVTSLTHTELAELDPTGISGVDGFPMDPGFHVAAVKTVNNLMDHRTAHQGPQLTDSLTWASISTPTYVLVDLKKRFFCRGSYGLTRRVLAVAAWFRSDTGGTSASVRVTLCPTRPKSTSMGDVVWDSPKSQVTFTTTSNTWGTSSEGELDLRYLAADGTCWIGIEVTAHAQTRGLAECIERERT